MAFSGWSSTASSNMSVGGLTLDGNIQTVSNLDNIVRGMMAELAAARDDGTIAKIPYAAKSGNYTAVAADINAEHRYTAAATVSLTAAATLGANWHYTVTADGGNVTIDPNGAETIDGLATIVIYNGMSARIVCDGSNFFSITKTPIWETVAVLTPSAASSAIATDLGASRFIRLSGFISTQSVAGILVAQFSTNNGSSYDTAANYFSQETRAASTTLTGSLAAAASGFILSSNVSTDASSGFAFEASIFEFNKNSIASGFSRSCPIISASRSLVSLGGFHTTTTARNALRISNASGGTITGTILVERMRG